MSTPSLNEINIRGYDTVAYAPPEYSTLPGIEIWSTHLTPSTDPKLNDCRPPPAYDTIDGLPFWGVPQVPSQLNDPPAIQQWIPESVTSTTDQQFSAAVVPLENTVHILKSRFLKARPVGIVMIFAAFVQVGVGGSLKFTTETSSSNTLNIFIPFWAPVIFLATAIQLFRTTSKPTTSKMMMVLLFSVASLVVGCVGMVYAVTDVGNLCSNMIGNGGFHGPSECGIFHTSVQIMYYILMADNAVVSFLAVIVFGIGSYSLAASRCS